MKTVFLFYRTVASSRLGDGELKYLAFGMIWFKEQEHSRFSNSLVSWFEYKDLSK